VLNLKHSGNSTYIKKNINYTQLKIIFSFAKIIYFSIIEDQTPQKAVMLITK